MDICPPLPEFSLFERHGKYSSSAIDRSFGNEQSLIYDIQSSILLFIMKYWGKFNDTGNLVLWRNDEMALGS